MRMVLIIRRSIMYTFLLLVLLLGNGCTIVWFEGPYKGRVIDAETKQPIVGAVAVGEWISKDFITGASQDYDTREVLTDSDGDFTIPGQGLQIFSEVREMALMIFKAEYEQSTLNIWSGLKEVKEAGLFKKPTFELRRLTMEERRNRGVQVPSGPKKKKRLMLMEMNKETKEIGLGDEYIVPVE